MSTYRKPLKYASTLPGSSLSAYPLLVADFDDSDLYAALAGGGGVNVTDADGADVPFGILRFDGTDGSSAYAITVDCAAATNLFTLGGDAAGLSNGNVVYSPIGFGGLTANTDYYVINLSGKTTGDTFQLALTPGGSAVDVTSDETGQSLNVLVCQLVLRAKLDLDAAASAGDTVGYLEYGSSVTTSQNKSGVLDADAVAYWPLEDSPTGSAGDIQDWSGNFDGTSSGSPASAGGQVANGLVFDGIDDFITLPALIDVSGGFTLSCWVNRSVFADHQLFSQSNGTQFSYYLRVGSSGSGMTIGGTFHEIASANPALGTWHYIALTFDGTTLTYYLNGALSSSGSISGTPDASAGGVSRLAAQATSPASDLLTGNMDEARIASAARSADWIAYEYANENVNSDTVTLGAEELVTPGASTARRITRGGEHLGLLLWEAAGLC